MSYAEEFTICMKYCNDAVGLSGINTENNFQIFPNPLENGKCTIKGLEGKNAIGVFDITGKKIISFESQIAEAAVDLSNFSKGIYILKIEDGNGGKAQYKIVN